MANTLLTRRSFVKAAAVAGLGLRAAGRAQTITERGLFTERDIPYACDELLKLLNEERRSFGLNALEMDELACKVAAEHARDMAAGHFISHWGRDGRKPYQRFSFAGGTAAIQENASSTDGVQSLAAPGIINDLRDMHQRMLAEQPPHDGHRKTILDPFHTHVGFGIALNGRSLRLDELYLARYVSLAPFTNIAKPKTSVVLEGRLLNREHFLNQVDVFYEPLPSPPSIDWLTTPRSVSLPSEHKTLRPKVPPGTRYTDGTAGDFDWSRKGTFKIKVRMFRDEPGIYTALFWIRRVATDKGFPGAEVCILSQ
jgi:Cysteine-rich secretory protein family